MTPKRKFAQVELNKDEIIPCPVLDMKNDGLGVNNLELSNINTLLNNDA